MPQVFFLGHVLIFLKRALLLVDLSWYLGWPFVKEVPGMNFTIYGSFCSLSSASVIVSTKIHKSFLIQRITLMVLWKGACMHGDECTGDFHKCYDPQVK